MAMASSTGQRKPYFPKADAAVLSAKHGPLPAYPQTVGPILDPDQVDKPIEPWPQDSETSFYPPKKVDYGPESIPEKPMCLSDRYLRAFLADNERLRLSMLWYYTRNILAERDFLSGLQEKAQLAQDSTGWEYVVIGLLDVNFYIRLATVGLSLAILPRGETICAHTVTQPPGNVFLLPNMLEDWRFQDSPYVELGGLLAYAGAPLRLQNESGDCVGLGSLCVASSTPQAPLNKLQQQTLARLADWVVSDIIQCARARRQRERRRMSDLISMAQGETNDAVLEEPVLRILRATYPEAVISLQSSTSPHIEIEGRESILLSDVEDGVWEDFDYIDDFIANSNHKSLPTTRVIRVIAAKFESISGPSLLVLGTKDFQLVFDDVDAWFVQTCASMLSQIWHKRLLAEVMRAKDKFLRGFSHQLRTPIHGILGSVELLAEELKSRTLSKSALLDVALAAQIAEPSIYLDTIKTAGRDLISIVNSMITLNRWADIAMTDRQYAIHTIYELEAELANEILRTISEDTRYRVSFLFNHDLPIDCDSLRIDLPLLRDSLLPLVINAIQNTSEGIVVIRASICSARKELVVDIEDTGCGIHPDHQQRIFEPYEKVDVHSTGAGLGLTLASKFATLLNGSVVLVSSDINRGSHFQATFREVDCACSSLPFQPLVQKLKNMPSKFYTIGDGLNGLSLRDYFSRFLTSHGFTSSDSIEDCLIIFNFSPDIKQHQTHLSLIPKDQVAICLIPASEGEACNEQTPNNVVYVSAPFLTSTMCSALEEAERLVLDIKASRTHLIHADRLSLSVTKPDNDPSTEEDAVTIADLPYLNGNSAQSNGANATDAVSDAILTPKQQPELAASGESGVVPTIFPGITSSPMPTALLVDDNVINLRILQMYCTKRGLPYVCASDGLQAVEMFSQLQSLSITGEAPAIELILMDLQMPVCDGVEATNKIRLLEKQNNWKKSTLFIVTGQDSPTDRTAAEAAGADEFFVKPVGIKLLDRGIQRHFPAFETS